MITLGIIILVFILLQYRRYLKFIAIPENVKGTKTAEDRYFKYTGKSEYNLYASLTAGLLLGTISFLGLIALIILIVEYLP